MTVTQQHLEKEMEFLYSKCTMDVGIISLITSLLRSTLSTTKNGAKIGVACVHGSNTSLFPFHNIQLISQFLYMRQSKVLWETLLNFFVFFKSTSKPRQFDCILLVALISLAFKSIKNPILENNYP